MALLTDRIGSYIAYGIATVSILWGVNSCGGRQSAEKRTGEVPAQLVRAQTDFATCKDNTSTLQGAIDRQNKSLSDLRKASEASIAESAKMASGAQKKALDAQARADRLIQRGLMGASQCERLLEADSQVLEALK